MFYNIFLLHVVNIIIFYLMVFFKILNLLSSTFYITTQLSIHIYRFIPKQTTQRQYRRRYNTVYQLITIKKGGLDRTLKTNYALTTLQGIGPIMQTCQ